MKWIVDYVVGNTYKVKYVEAKTSVEAIKKANVKNIVDIKPLEDTMIQVHISKDELIEKKYILIKSNNFYDADDIESRLQTEKYDTYENAYNTMKNEVIKKLKLDDKGWQKYIVGVLDHIEYSNVYLNTWSARIHTDFGEYSSYWKIIEA